MSKTVLIAIFLLVVIVVGLGVYYWWSTTQKPKEVTLVVLSPEWEPGKIAEELSQEFTEYAEEVLGYKVYVKYDFTPWSTYYQRVTSIMTSKSSEADLIFADSQWLGELYEGGHIISIKDLVENDPELRSALLEDTFSNLVYYYTAYPQGSDNYVGVPGYPDAVRLVFYRKDLFTNPQERAAFKQKYGYDLPQTLDDWKNLDWTQLRDIAEFFTRKKGETLAGETLTEDFYGIALVLARDYDYISCYFLDVFWSWGAELWDPNTHDPRGYINSTQAKEALEFFVSLVDYMPPGAPSFGYDEVISLYSQGKVAMTILWPSMAPAIFDPSASKVADKTGVGIIPGHNGVRYLTLGGQPLVISAYSKHKEEAKLYLKWFYTNTKFQKEFALRTGETARKSIAQSQEFLQAKPWTTAFLESIPYAKDFWNIPYYGRMLEVQQIYFNKAVAKEIDPSTALDKIAEEQWNIVKEAEGK
ncbi:MAG: extracellular solute-binding protein [Desulfurococcales archaeon]|nr:extracellular solute-binding protein [Desulfurococcales archaeon]